DDLFNINAGIVKLFGVTTLDVVRTQDGGTEVVEAK
uniref:Malate dehydrogenase, mitochondrial (Fragments) n=2 Tax=Spermatophyta TaxID=58024 RepID=MDHM_CAPAA|nr:RecName: Full=Malate dehydrogenase, mitochondrial [Capsicum annuum var. annuum]